MKHIRQLQTLVADSSGCAVLSLIMKIMFNPDIVPGGQQIAEKMVRLILEWPASSGVDGESDSIPPDDQRGAVFYAISGEKTGSYFLETVLECAPLPFVQGIYLCKYVISQGIITRSLFNSYYRAYCWCRVDEHCRVRRRCRG
jgi:hypothetical protein